MSCISTAIVNIYAALLSIDCAASQPSQVTSPNHRPRRWHTCIHHAGAMKHCFPMQIITAGHMGYHNMTYS